MLILAACGTNSAALGKAYGEKAKADLVDDAIAIGRAETAEARKVPRLPPECRVRFRSGAVAGDGYDVIGKKTDIALGRANDRLAWCVALSDGYSAAREPLP